MTGAPNGSAQPCAAVRVVPFPRRTFAKRSLCPLARSPRLYVTALGLYECSINGQRVGGLTSASGSLKTLYGEIISQWEITDGEFRWTVIVPPNTTATAYLPADHNQAITLDGSLVTGLVHDLQAGTHMFVVE